MNPMLETRLTHSLSPPSPSPTPPPPLIHTHSNSSVILGQNNGNVPRILGIIADVCAESALQDDEQVYMRLLSIARHIQVCKTDTLMSKSLRVGF
jgi:hypothetical protein